jgi:hypothetical protein
MLVDLKLGLILILAFIATSSGIYFYGHWEGSASCDARHESEALADYKKRTEDAEKKSKALEGELTKARAYTQKMERLVTYEVSKNDVYHSCVMPSAGVQLLNQAITGDTAR